MADCERAARTAFAASQKPDPEGRKEGVSLSRLCVRTLNRPHGLQKLRQRLAGGIRQAAALHSIA